MYVLLHSLFRADVQNTCVGEQKLPFFCSPTQLFYVLLDPPLVQNTYIESLKGPSNFIEIAQWEKSPKKNSLKECVFVNSALKIQCHIHLRAIFEIDQSTQLIRPSCARYVWNDASVILLLIVANVNKYIHHHKEYSSTATTQSAKSLKKQSVEVYF